jgi:hypothetical protein
MVMYVKGLKSKNSQGKSKKNWVEKNCNNAKQ